jgi:hypothetical protein
LSANVLDVYKPALGKGEVDSSILSGGTTKPQPFRHFLRSGRRRRSPSDAEQRKNAQPNWHVSDTRFPAGSVVTGGDREAIEADFREYLRRNRHVAAAIGARAAIDLALERLGGRPRTPQWLIDLLLSAHRRVEPLPAELAAWRNLLLPSVEIWQERRGFLLWPRTMRPPTSSAPRTEEENPT